MRKGRLVKGLAIGIVCSMAFLSACGKKTGVITEGVDRPATEIDKDHVYSFDDLDFPDEGDCHISSVCTSRDMLYVQGYINDENDYRSVVYRMPFESGDFEEVKSVLSKGENASIGSMTCDDEGNLYLVKNVYINDGEETDAPEETDGEAVEASEESDVEAADTSEEADGEVADMPEDTDAEATEAEEAEDLEDDAELEESYDEFKEEVYVVKVSPEGNILWETPLVSEDESSYIRSIVCAGKTGLLTCTDAGYSLYDMESGQGKSIIKREANENEDYFDAYLFRVKNGDVYLCSSDNGDKSKLYRFDTEKLCFDDNGIELPDEVYDGYNLYSGKAYDFYTVTNSEICGFNIGDAKTTKIVDYTASNMIVDHTAFVGETSDGKLIVSTESYSNDESGLCFLEKVDPAAIVDKEIITLGTVYLSDAVRKQVVRFNKKSDKYKINIMDYADYDDEDTGDTYLNSVNKLSLDITQGNSPDIIVVDSDMPFESYVVKGVLEPLDPYFEADTEINVTDYLQNVLDSTKVKNQMYSVIPSFIITTCVAAKDNLGNNTVTIDNYNDICKKLGIDPSEGMGTVTREYAGELYETIANTYIDYENGTCSFDTDSFVHFLEFMKELPESSDDMDYEKYDSYYRENKSLLMTYYFASFEDYQVLKKGYFGKEITFNGYPGSKDGKSYIYPQVQVAMSSSCKDKQAAWEFIKTFLSEDYQKKVDWGFPIQKEALQAMAAKSQEKPYYLDSDGNKVETSSVWDIGGTEVTIEELSKEESQTVVDFVESVTTSSKRDQNVVKIIEEEAAAFYEGQKTAEEVADVIQSRVSIYLSEQM